ncbi:MAG: hypothetical protein ACJA0Q_000764 [Saprospiraceae bacterium]|jgi:hypothetical protein
MNVKIIIEAAEWNFEETLPFAVEKINDKQQDFELPLYDKNGDENGSVTLPDCRVIELIGEDDEAFHVVFENVVIKSHKQSEVDDNEIEINIQLALDRPLWQQGEDSGIFYSWGNLPEELKEFKIRKH